MHLCWHYGIGPSKARSHCHGLSLVVLFNEGLLLLLCANRTPAVCRDMSLLAAIIAKGPHSNSIRICLTLRVETVLRKLRLCLLICLIGRCCRRVDWACSHAHGRKTMHGHLTSFHHLCSGLTQSLLSGGPLLDYLHLLLARHTKPWNDRISRRSRLCGSKAQDDAPRAQKHQIRKPQIEHPTTLR